MQSNSAIHENSKGHLLYAMWFGLLTGLVDVSVLAVQKLLLHKAIHLSPLFIWMAPLADVLLFAIPGFCLFLIARCCPKLASLPIAVFVFSFLGFSSLLFVFPRLHRIAMFLLAAGLAMQAARFISKHTNGFHSLARRSLGWMVFLVVGPALGVHGWQILTERSGLAKLPPAPPDAPNVLLITLDTVRARNMSLLGYERPTTPQLERIARSGVLFERAISTSPWTLPSHASMFTGHYPHELLANWLTPLGVTYPTLAEIFSDRGYLTAGFVANTYYCGYEFGLSRGFTHYEDYLISPGEIMNSSSLGELIFAGRMNSVNIFRKIFNNYQFFGRKSAEKLNNDFLSWLPRSGGRPFFAFLNYYDAHDPYIPPKPFDAKFGPVASQSNVVDRLLQSFHKPKPVFHQEKSPETQMQINAYDGSIAYLDHQLGRLVDELDRRDLLANTLFIIASDHGEQFGEHGLFKHCNSLYRQLLQVPLLISFPSHVPAGKRIREPVTLRDLPATVLDLVGFQGDDYFPGYSLARFWNSEGDSCKPEENTLLAEVRAGINTPESEPISKGKMKSLVSGGYHYILNGDGREELYDFVDDEDEESNLAGLEEGRGMLPRFRRLLSEVLSEKPSPN